MPVDRMTIAARAAVIDMAAQKAAASARETHDEFVKAASYRNPGLTSEAVEAERSTRKHNAQNAARDAAKTQRSQLTAAVNYLNQYMPTVSGTDGLLAVQQAWENVRARLDSGIPWQQITERATEHEALAVQKFAPDYLAAAEAAGRGSGFDRQYASDRLEELRGHVDRGVTRRLGQLATDPGISEALTVLADAPAQVAAAEPYLKAMESTGTPSHSLMDAAVASSLARGGNPRGEAA